MEKVSCLPLGSLISMLQTFEKQYGADMPVLIADTNSSKPICGVADCFVAELINKDTNEKQKMVVLANFVAERTEESE
jgi:hypothetical protein